MIGKTLAHYEINSQLGKGGMGEVYQAKDTKLGRDVAIKVLPEEFAKDADRVARFQREAKLLASLNHPNIAAIHGLEESDGTHFLVMELIEGDTLADRIKTSVIPVEESLKLALQITEALEAAHEKGVIHRDLKPANIKVTPDGKVKVLDFGLAKALARDQVEVNLSQSPTLSEAATLQGVILGTAAYMSPEQARGKAVDKRTDIWAFGCVLYEMLTGKAVFQGEDVTEILAAVVKSGVNLNLLPANIHPRIREVISRCLRKELKNRYRDIGDAQFEVKQVLADPSGIFVQPVTAAKPRRKLRVVIPWIAASIAIVAIIVGFAVWNLRLTEPRQVIRFDYELPEDQQLSNRLSSNLGISADGKQMVYCTPEGLYLRSVDELNAKIIPGSDRSPSYPFFSPDGKLIAYVSESDGKLKRIAIKGGTPFDLCEVDTFAGGSWNEEGFIVFGKIAGGLMRVSSNGGTPVTIVEQKFGPIFNPQVLPNGKAVLYTAGQGQARIMAKPLNSEEPIELFPGQFIRYLPSGHMVYRDYENNLCAVWFDSDRLKAVGDHISMVPDVDDAAISDSGTLIYTSQTSQEESVKYTLVWVDKEGKEEPLEAESKEYNSPKISPDGKLVALLIGPMGRQDIWIWNIERKTLSKLTFDETNEVQPIWTTDSKRIIYYSDHEAETQGGIYWRAADGTGKVEELISASDRRLMPWSMPRDGKILLIQELVSWTNADIGMMPMEGDRELTTLLQKEYSEAQPTISPDGRLMAYLSSETEGEVMKEEVYVRSFPDIEESREQVSTGGGNCPLWSPDGKELFYLSSDNYVMAVSVKTEPTLSLGAPKRLFKNTNLGLDFGAGCTWDIHPDGKRFLMIAPPEGADGAAAVTGPRKITFVFNWDEELKKLASVD